MEDMARLAVVEQRLRSTDKFAQGVFNLLDVLNYILENPHQSDLRIIPIRHLHGHLGSDAFDDYLKYIGFEKIDNFYKYPSTRPLSKLRIAQSALQRKIRFCFGTISSSNIIIESGQSIYRQPKKVLLVPARVLRTRNSLLLKIESLFNNMIKYEEDALQQHARKHIPLATLQLKAIDRIREHQSKIKSGETKTPDLPFDIAMLMELMGWFKHKFFKWMEKPQCERCGGASKYMNSAKHTAETEICTVEVYQCVKCRHRVFFPRYNDPRTLLRTRRGRCGEWANCFTLMCRALGYDTRYVYDTTDHVWCEVYDFDSKTWLHVDPCEGKLDAPLLYSHGWGKKLSYVIAVSKDDVQDVTWRYTSDHKEVLKRRNLCSESELLSSIMTLREHRQRQVSEARRRFLVRRTIEELVQLLIERKPSDYESHGRISGSVEWRMRRGEHGAAIGHTFEFTNPGDFVISYFPVIDEYQVTGDLKPHSIRPWFSGAYTASNVRRKLEDDWKMVYIAREENEKPGTISWRIKSGPGLIFTTLSVRALTQVYNNASITWATRFDDGDPQPANIGETPIRYERRFRTAQISAELSGGSGEVAWQHAQLFRLPTNSTECGFYIHASVASEAK